MASNKKKYSLKGEDILIFSGNSNPELARKIVDYLDIPLASALVERFSDGEVRVQIEETVRGKEVFIIQPTCRPVNDSLMELLIMIDAVQRASSTRVTAVIPYYGYAKQEKKAAGREPISAKLVANLITTAGATRVITIDLHAAAIQGFFDIPVDNLMALPIMVKYFQEKGMYGKDVVIVSPDVGGVARASDFANLMGAGLAIIFKRRPYPEEAKIIEMVGDVQNKTAIIVDDMISTAGTLLQATEALKERGASDIYACATHPIMSKNALENIIKSPLKEVIVTDTIPLPIENKKFDKIVIQSVAPLLGEAIKRNYFNLSVSKLFRLSHLNREPLIS
ncbi:MAG: ribose-phosphate pyrophosphokinase [Candidatus Eremiobacteraeota bacterium]|nr:ribose-phosphate pyrophosphokinase [Candidatus Eremiobacteraeota bacterium]